MPKRKNRHLNIQNHIEIEKGLNNKDSFASLARKLKVFTSTISREVQQNRYLHIPKGRKFYTCIQKRDYALASICSPTCEITLCKSYSRVRCYEVRSDFEEHTCEIIGRAPYVRGDCYPRGNCEFRHTDYYVVKAQVLYELRLGDTREGISVDPYELA